MTTTEPVACEQVVIAWSSVNLLGNSGKGPVAASDGWKLSSNDPLAGLGESGRYLTEDAAALVGDGILPPVALEYRPDSGGVLLVAKTYAASSRRGGQYQVHAIRDATGRCSPWDLWAAQDAGLLITDELTHELPLRLPLLRLRPADPPAWEPRATDAAALGLLLERLQEGRPFVLKASDQGAAEDVVRRLLACLPLGVTRGVPVSTMAARPAAVTHGVAIAVPPFSRGFDHVDVDLDADAPARAVAGAGATELASALLSASRRELDAITSMTELQAWLGLRRASLSSLTMSQLREACRPTLFPVLLELLARDVTRGETLLRVRNDTEARRDFAAGLERNAAEYADVVAPLFGSATGLSAPDHAELQGWLLEAVGAAAFERYVLGPLLVETEPPGAPVVVDSPALAQVLADRLRDRVELVDFAFRTTTPTWTAVTDHQVQSHLLAGDPLPSGVRRLMRDDPGKLAMAIDQLLAGLPDEPRLTQRLLQWPDDDVDTLIAAVLRSERLDRAWATKLLDQRPPRVVRAALDAWWPRIAAHLGIPDAVAQQLEIKPTRWWEKW